MTDYSGSDYDGHSLQRGVWGEKKMLKVHRIVVFSLLLVVLSQGRLCAQRADDTINRALERLSRALIESFNNLERREFRNRLAGLEFENGF